jgi:hypothetical protein
VRTDYVQNNFLSGVLDERAGGRVETDSYNNGLLVGENIEPVHLGGVRVRRGFRYLRKLPNILTRVTSGVTVTAPNGGTTANANDDVTTTLVTTTNNVSTTTPYIVLHYDLGSAKSVMFVDALDIRSSGGSSTEFFLQYSLDNVAWTVLSDNVNVTHFDLVDETPRSYRRGLGQPDSPHSARYIRLVKIGGTDMGANTITLEVRNIDFEVSTEEQYMVVLTDRTATIVRDGELVRFVPTPYESADLLDIDADSDAETMTITHQDYAPRFLLRETETNFQCDPIDFDAIPLHDFNDVLSPTPVSDVQVLTFGSGWVQGDTFQIELMGARTGSIPFAGDATATERAATASNIARAVQKLYTVEGYTGVSCARTGALAYTVTFADASANTYELMSAVGVSAAGSAVIVVTQSAAGTPRAEPAWSATRGYPRTVAFYEGRLWFGGTRDLQQTLFGSEVFNILNFEVLQGLADEPIIVPITGAQLNSINALFAGRSFQIFTGGGEYRFVKPQGVPIVPGDKPVLQTGNGAKKIRPVTIDGATQFAQRTGKSIRDFRFNFEEDAFDSLGVSSLAPHLINDVVDLAVWNGSREDEMGLVFVVNGDGTAAVLNSRKEAQIQAWVKWTTLGEFKAVGVVFEDIYFSIARTIDGVDGLYLEMGDPDYRTDCAIKTQAFSQIDDTHTLVGLGALLPLAGEEVRVRASGYALPNATVSDTGSITIGMVDMEEVEVGLNFNPTVTPMPLNTMTPRGPTFMDKRRIVGVWVKVRNTLGIRINGKPIPDRKFDINAFDAPAAVPVSGNFKLDESTGWDYTDDKIVTFDQVDPLPFEILAIKVKMESS